MDSNKKGKVTGAEAYINAAKTIAENPYFIQGLKIYSKARSDPQALVKEIKELRTEGLSDNDTGYMFLGWASNNMEDMGEQTLLSSLFLEYAKRNGMFKEIDSEVLHDLLTCSIQTGSERRENLKRYTELIEQIKRDKEVEKYLKE